MEGPQGAVNRPKKRGRIHHFIFPKVCPVTPDTAKLARIQLALISMGLQSMFGGPATPPSPAPPLPTELGREGGRKGPSNILKSHRNRYQFSPAPPPPGAGGRVRREGPSRILKTQRNRHQLDPIKVKAIMDWSANTCVQESCCGRGTPHRNTHPETGEFPNTNHRKTKDNHRDRQKLKDPAPTLVRPVA